MSKKGVSAEEKKTRILQLFYETGECFQLKELEKRAPKEKGVIANSVKDVVQKLVDDGLVDTDKIGGSIFFWAFPSKGLNTKTKALAELQNKYEENSKKIKIMEKTLLESKSTEQEKTSKIKILDEIKDLELEIDENKRKLKFYQENDPQKFSEIAAKTTDIKDAANRWTDNIFETKSWCKRKFGMEDNVLNKQFGIPDDFDYVE